MKTSSTQGDARPTDRGNHGRQLVCVQGLGFVGAAMAVAVANAKDAAGRVCFDVVGVDLPTKEGKSRIESLNTGHFPFESGDAELECAVQKAHLEGNLIATTDDSYYSRASIVLVDVHCDIRYANGKVEADLQTLRKAIALIGQRIQPGTLIIVETTVPPGTCAHLIAPTIQAGFRERGLPEDSFYLAHSYERVMPGRDYYRSIVNFWRVYAGHTPEAGERCAAFLRQVINTKEYPLSRLDTTTASETAKVLENTFRAATIAFIDEWGRFAEAAGIDLFQVLDVIRVRPTHSNIRQPGFGVGGYCLTKDPLFGKFAAEEFFGRTDLDFPFSMAAVRTNNEMPIWSVRRLQELVGGGLEGKKILLLGVTYRPDVADTRYSPSAIFLAEAERLGAQVTCYDPLVSMWPELSRPVETKLPAAGAFDAVVFAVSNKSYQALDLRAWIGRSKPIVLDANDVLTKQQRQTLRGLGCEVQSIGRGENL
jgi:UDP-N-acetyl-D-glucosamine dehydrogenase